MSILDSKGFFEKLYNVKSFTEVWSATVDTAENLTDQGLEAASVISEQMLAGDFSDAVDTALDSAAQLVDTATYNGATKDAIELSIEAKTSLIREAENVWVTLKATDTQISQYLLAPENSDIFAAAQGNPLPLLAKRVWLPLGQYGLEEVAKEVQEDFQFAQDHYIFLGRSLEFFWNVANVENASNWEQVSTAASSKIADEINDIQDWADRWKKTGEYLFGSDRNEIHPLKLAFYSVVKTYFDVERIGFLNDQAKSLNATLGPMALLMPLKAINFESGQIEKRVPEMKAVLEGEKDLEDTLWSKQMLGSVLVYGLEGLSLFLKLGSFQPLKQRAGSKFLEYLGLGVVTGLKMESHAMADGQKLDWRDPKTWLGIGKALWNKRCLEALLAVGTFQGQQDYGVQQQKPGSGGGKIISLFSIADDMVVDPSFNKNEAPANDRLDQEAGSPSKETRLAIPEEFSSEVPQTPSTPTLKLVPTEQLPEVTIPISDEVAKQISLWEKVEQGLDQTDDSGPLELEMLPFNPLPRSQGGHATDQLNIRRIIKDLKGDRSMVLRNQELPPGEASKLLGYRTTPFNVSSRGVSRGIPQVDYVILRLQTLGDSPREVYAIGKITNLFSAAQIDNNLAGEGDGWELQIFGSASRKIKVLIRDNPNYEIAGVTILVPKI